MTYDYMESQLGVILDETDNAPANITVKFNSDIAKTNWLSISDETFKKIHLILTTEGK
jgi:hypothetical protein